MCLQMCLCLFNRWGVVYFGRANFGRDQNRSYSGQQVIAKLPFYKMKLGRHRNYAFQSRETYIYRKIIQCSFFIWFVILSDSTDFFGNQIRFMVRRLQFFFRNQFRNCMATKIRSMVVSIPLFPFHSLALRMSYEFYHTHTHTHNPFPYNRVLYPFAN